MRTSTYISTLSLLNTPRAGTARMQTDLVRLNKEVITGRMADVGLNLGADTGRSVTLHVDVRSLAALAASNATVTTRLEQAQAGLDQMRQGASTFLGQLIGARDSSASAGLIKQTAAAALSGFIASANASDGRNYLFAGVNTSTAPIAGYDAGPGAAVDAAFLAKFGVTQSDPAAASIATTDMAAFLDDEFAALFADPDWGTTWSTASDQPVTNRIAPTETVETSVSVNQPAMRKLAMVYTMVAKLGIDGLGTEARQAVLDKAIRAIGEAVDGLVDLQSAIGTTQNRVKDASERLSVQQTILERRISVLEGVDPVEAKVRIDMLTTQIEMSYSLTAKLLQMSILNYV